jgi:hypothetical protein
MTTCTCDTHSASSNTTVLTVDQTNATSSATQVAYFHSANGSQPYVIFAEGGTNSILGKTYTAGGVGVYGQATNSSGYGVFGYCSNSTNGIGVLGGSVGSSGIGVQGSGNTGVKGYANLGNGFAGVFTCSAAGSSAIYASDGGGIGTWALDTYGYRGCIHAKTGDPSFYVFYGEVGYFYHGGSGYFNYLSKGGGGWRTDHPTKPETHFLNHGFVESDVMRNEYPGNVMLDAKGEALVEMPDWFPHVNSEPSVTVTAKGKRMSTGWEQIDNKTFKLLGDAGGEVSYMISCKRSDQWTKKNCPGIEIEKTDEEKGLYMHPELFGPDAKHLHHKMLEATEKSSSAIKAERGTK